MKNNIITQIVAALIVAFTSMASLEAQSPTPIPLVAPTSTPKPMITLVPQPLTASQVTAFLTQLAGGTPATPVPVVGMPPAGTAIKRLVLVISSSGSGMIYGEVQ